MWKTIIFVTRAYYIGGGYSKQGDRLLAVPKRLSRMECVVFDTRRCADQ
jgi:hypothetical protein